MSNIGWDRLERGPGEKPRQKIRHLDKLKATANMEESQKNFITNYNDMIDTLSANGDMEPK